MTIPLKTIVTLSSPIVTPVTVKVTMVTIKVTVKVTIDFCVNYGIHRVYRKGDDGDDSFPYIFLGTFRPDDLTYFDRKTA